MLRKTSKVVEAKYIDSFGSAQDRLLHYALKSVVSQGNFQALRSRMTEGGGIALESSNVMYAKSHRL